MHALQTNQFFHSNILDRTLEAYGHTHENTWIHDAIEHRLHISDFFINHDGGYLGITSFTVGTMRVAYVGIATVFKEWRNLGIAKAMLKKLILFGYDACLLRTQNPAMAHAMIDAFGHVAPITEKPSIHAHRVVEVYAKRDGYPYDQQDWTCRGIYNGNTLTGEVPVHPAREKAMLDTYIDATKGDAMYLVSLFNQEFCFAN